MTKPSAGNTGRHEDSILWDRLRADLNNLGAAYGELPPPIEQEPIVAVANTAEASADYREHQWSGLDTDAWVIRNCIHCGINAGAPLSSDRPGGCPRPQTADDWWAYKTRMQAQWRAEDMARAKESEGRIARLTADIAKLPKPFVPDPATDTLSKAIARPLDWEPRVGWKPGDCE